MMDRVFYLVLIVTAILVAGLVAIIVIFLFSESYALLAKIGFERFFTDAGWQPTMGQFNILPMMISSVLLMFGAVLFAAPMGVFIAIYFKFYAPRVVTMCMSRVIEVLAAIPSVIYGLWGLVVIVPLVGAWHQPGASLLAGLIVLSLMIFPTIVIIVYSGLVALPQSYVMGAQALALNKNYMIRKIVLPAVRRTIASGVMLGAARAIGETMAVMMVTGNIVNIPGNLFQPVRALTSNIALEMAYAINDHRGALYVSSLLLLVIVIILVTINEFFISSPTVN